MEELKLRDFGTFSFKIEKNLESEGTHPQVKKIKIRQNLLHFKAGKKFKKIINENSLKKYLAS